MNDLVVDNQRDIDLGTVSNFSNASGAHPSEFNLDYYNSLVTNTNENQDLLNKVILAITDVNNFATEYQRQSTEHASQGDYTDSQISDAWRDTALRMRDELIKKRDRITPTLGIPTTVTAPMPSDFKLDYLNSLINADKDAPQLINALDFNIPLIDSFIQEYNRQSIEHANATPPDYTDSQIAASWRDTALAVKNNLQQKRDVVYKWINNPRNPKNLTSTDVTIPTTVTAPNDAGNGKQTDGSTNTTVDDGKIFGMSKGMALGVGAVVLVGGFLLLKKIFK
ncbi:MAG TPA: hypothetical protein VN026_15975 [Bacteroidia bacterium]|jgi:hypothetical protein|nr:hypothetical protein [Bacteroidia bacterium]